MKKSIYTVGSIEIIVGALLLCITFIIKEMLPVLGRIAYQMAAGSYTPNDFKTSFLFANIFATVLIVVGLAQIVYQFKKSGIQ